MSHLNPSHLPCKDSKCSLHHGFLPSSAYKGQNGSAWKLTPLRGNSHPWLTGTGGPFPHVPQNHSAAGSQHLRIPQPASFSVCDGNGLDNIPSVFPPCFTSPSAAGLSRLHFPNKPLAFESLPWGQLLGEPTLGQVCPTEFMALCYGSPSKLYNMM